MGFWQYCLPSLGSVLACRLVLSKVVVQQTMCFVLGRENCTIDVKVGSNDLSSLCMLQQFFKMLNRFKVFKTRLQHSIMFKTVLK